MNRREYDAIHPGLAHFPHYDYSDFGLELRDRFFHTGGAPKRYSVSPQDIMYGHVIDWHDQTSWLHFQRTGEEVATVLAMFHKTVDNLFKNPVDEDTAQKVGRGVAFRLARSAVQLKIQDFADNKPIYISGHHVYRAFSDQCGDKTLEKTLGELPEPFGSAMMQTWRALQMHTAPWHLQKQMGNEMSALLYEYSLDLFRTHPGHGQNKTEVQKCFNCGSAEVETVVKTQWAY